jgi:hypothetical protein
VPQQEITVSATAPDGSITTFKAMSRIDTPIDVQYYRDGGNDLLNLPSVPRFIKPPMSSGNEKPLSGWQQFQKQRKYLQ